MPAISVITVVYNNVAEIRATMESYFSQTWTDKEYIVIDGGSTDGTVDIIREYEDRLAYFCSEPDGGLYEAMNKGLQHCSGTWVNILNSGDYYVKPTALAEMMSSPDVATADILYADSLQHSSKGTKRIAADSTPERLMHSPCYRHGSSLVRLSVHLRYPFDVARKKDLKYALDFDIMHRMYRDGCVFKKVDTCLEIYEVEGVSNHPFENLWLNYKIYRRSRFDVKAAFFFLKKLLRASLTHNPFYPYIRGFATEFMVNDVLSLLPWVLRRAYLKALGAKIGKEAFIMKHTYFVSPWLMKLGHNSRIERGCTIDAQGGIKIGENVVVGYGAKLLSCSHDAQSKEFDMTMGSILLEDYAWVDAGAIILPNVVIGKGAVVNAGAVVTESVAPYSIVGGVPAQVIGKRSREIQYTCKRK